MENQEIQKNLYALQRRLDELENAHNVNLYKKGSTFDYISAVSAGTYQFLSASNAVVTVMFKNGILTTS